MTVGDGDDAPPSSIEVDGSTYTVVPVDAPGLDLPAPLLDVFDDGVWVTRSSDEARIRSSVARYRKAGAEPHWTATYTMPEAMPEPGGLFPPAELGRVIPEIVALGVCVTCGWVHARCIAHSRTDGGAPCGTVRRRGQLVCAIHGGNAPDALEKAERTMTERKALAEVGRLIAEAELEVEGKSGAERLVAAMNRAGAMALSYRWLLESLPAESAWSWVEHNVASFTTDDGSEVSAGFGAPTRWVKVDTAGLLGPDAKGQLTLHPYEEALRYWTKLEGDLLVQAAKLGLDERRQLFAEAQVAKIGDAITALVGGLGHSLDDPKVVPVVEAALLMIAGGDATAIEPGATSPIEASASEADPSPLWGEG